MVRGLGALGSSSAILGIHENEEILARGVCPLCPHRSSTHGCLKYTSNLNVVFQMEFNKTRPVVLPIE